MATQAQRVQLGAQMANWVYKPGNPPPAGWDVYRTVDGQGTGLDAVILKNTSTNSYFFAVAGTNEGKDVAKWPSAITGYEGNKVQIDVATAAMDILNDEAKAENATVQIGGHSLAGQFVDIGASTFGWEGVKFDAVGGASVINSAGFSSMLASNGITSANGGDVISCNINGIGPLGGSLVGAVGGQDIAGTTNCRIELPSSTASGVINTLAYIFGGPVVGTVVKIGLGALQHDMIGIEAAVQSGNFTVNGLPPLLIPGVLPYSFIDEDGNTFRTVLDANGSPKVDSSGNPILEVVIDSPLDGVVGQKIMFNSVGDEVTLTPTGAKTYTVESTSNGNTFAGTGVKNSEGEIELTGITSVNGQAPEASTSGITNAALAGAHITTGQLLENPGNVTPYVEAVDKTNTQGGTLSNIIPASARNPDGSINWDTLFADPKFQQSTGDAVSLILAVRSGQPLSIASAGFNVLSHHTTDPTILGISASLSGITSLKGLVDALEKGDLGRILIDGGGVARSAVTIYQNSLYEQLLDSTLSSAELAAVQAQIDGASALLGQIGQAVAVLNIINSLAKGDIKGAFIGAVAMMGPYGPLAAAALQVVDTVVQLAQPDHVFEGRGHYAIQANGSFSFVVSPKGTPGTDDQDDMGGGSEVIRTMNQMIGSLQQQAQSLTTALNQPFGLIPERMPTIEFKGDQMYLRYKDSSGQTAFRSFDLKGNYLLPGFVENIQARSPWGNNYKPWDQSGTGEGRYLSAADAVAGGEIATTDDFYQNIYDQFYNVVLQSGAMAPQWEVDTATAQRNAGKLDGVLGSQYSYMNQVQIDNGNAARYAKPYTQTHAYQVGGIKPGSLATGPDQNYAPLVIDLDGDGQVAITQRATGNGVLWDVDNDGYAEETDWVGPRDGMLVLDRNGDGKINSAADLLSDIAIDGVNFAKNPLDFLDANGDGKFTSADPVFSQIKVWQDINQDGAAQDAEVRTLAQVGVTSINYERSNSRMGGSVGTVTLNGQPKAVLSAILNAEQAGIGSAPLSGNSVMVTDEADREIYDGDAIDIWRGLPYLVARQTLDYGSNASTATGHVHSSGALVATDEALDGQEDMTIVVSVAQLLKNDHSSAGTVSFDGLTGTATGGVARFDAASKTVYFTPSANFNGSASFNYTVKDAQGNSVVAKAVVDVGAVNDEPVLTVTANRRQANWTDIGITTNAAGVNVYVMPKFGTIQGTGTSVIPDVQPTNVAILGYTGPDGSDIKPTSDGVIGFSQGKMYFAWLGTKGNAASIQLWQEIWVNGDGSGKLAVSDADTPGPISMTVDDQRKGRFGDVSVTPNADGTASFNYVRTELFNVDAHDALVGGDTQSTVHVDAVQGPQDAFYVRMRQAINGKNEDTYQKVMVDQTPNLGVESAEGRLALKQGSTSIDAGGQPIVLDLNDNGFLFTGVNDSTAYYDLAGDGVRRQTAWTSGKDGILAFDANNDGKISGKAEISFKDYLPGAQTDLQGLAAFDTNHDGKFSSTDAQWSRFRVWQDKNEDGNQTADELSTLSERGITSINLTSNNLVSSAGGVQINGVGSYTRIDGSQSALADVSFAFSTETAAGVVNDSLVMTSANTNVSTGGGDDQITGTDLADQIDAGTGNDLIKAGAGNDVVTAGAGNDTVLGGEGNDLLWGGNGNDQILGEAGSDQLHGGAGNDRLNGGVGNDDLWGGTGDDVLTGGEGVDTYHYALGDGHDNIIEVGGEVSSIVLGEGITAATTQFEMLSDGTGYVLRFSGADSLTVQGLGSVALTSTQVQVSFGDGTTQTLAQLLPGVPTTNHAPTVATALTNKTATEDSAWTFAVPAGSFTDQDAGDVLTYSATQADGTALPSWLNFNAATQTFSGTPLNAHVGTLSLKVTATDKAGLTASSSFDVVVANTNDAPTVATALTNKTATEDSAWTFAVPAGSFTDQDAGDVLTYSATMANGNALPSWLSFNAATQTFSGTPLNAYVGTLSLKAMLNK